MTIKGTQTEQNLIAAFVRESQERNQYEFFAKAAKKEGYVQIANCFEAFSLHERSHAKSFFKFLEGNSIDLGVTVDPIRLGNTRENLQLAVQGEHQEHTHLYPRFADIAKTEGCAEIAVLFKAIGKAEKYHEKTFRAYIDHLQNGTLFSRNEPVEWLCSKCGYVHTGKDALLKCPGCGHPQAYFEVAYDIS